MALREGRSSTLLSYGPLVYLGKISYGLYALHLTAILVVKALVHGRHLPIAVQIASELGLTIVAAAISYRYLERPFLVLKERFTSVRSRPV